MGNWSLNSLYHDFDDHFKNDLKTYETSLEQLEVLSNNLEGVESLEAWLKLSQESSTVARSLGAYTQLRLSTNVQDAQAKMYLGQMMNLGSRFSKPQARFSKWLASSEENFNTWVNENKLIKEHEFILRETIKVAQYRLSDDVEEAISKLRINASSSWSQLQSHLTSLNTIEFNNETHTMTSLRNLALSSDATLRKEAYSKELEIYKGMEESIAFSLNSIKGEVLQVNELRGYTSPIEETLINSRLSQETLDALLNSIDKALPEFRRYLKHKAKLLGHTNGLPWYDLFAPLTDNDNATYTIEDAKNIINNSFSTFSDDLVQLSNKAFDEKWVDFYPKEGKRGGAFCFNLPQIKESRILLNFGGSISNIITLAHELGHAYHGFLLQDNSILNTRYTMPVAETASTFCENIVLNATLKEASLTQQVMLLESSLQDLIQITVDIYSRFKFEKEIFEKRKHTFLSTQDLKDIMIQAQKETYGDGLDESTYHPYMWVCKSHYYNAQNNFYNFPYAFGGLFALGLYAQYEKQKDSFVDKYRTLLQKTATASCEDVALLADIDTTTTQFWDESIQQIIKRIDTFIELTS